MKNLISEVGWQDAIAHGFVAAVCPVSGDSGWNRLSFVDFPLECQNIRSEF
jgi:hypothetical protein